MPTPNAKLKSKPNASILTFFKKQAAEAQLFVQPNAALDTFTRYSVHDTDDSWEQSRSKRRKTSSSSQNFDDLGLTDQCVPTTTTSLTGIATLRTSLEHKPKTSPFVDMSESDTDDETKDQTLLTPVSSHGQELVPPSSGDFEEFQGLGDLDDEDLIPEEQLEDQDWNKRQQFLKLEEDMDEQSLTRFPELNDKKPTHTATTELRCPICNESLADMSDDASTIHVNQCLDRGCSPPPLVPQNEAKAGDVKSPPPEDVYSIKTEDIQTQASILKRSPSAFSKIMSGHAEDAAWATAAASQVAARGKPAFERSCPFYKIMPGLSITVDAFRYGAVEGCKAYFLSHFHSDHYIGLTARWCHGPIYCSRVTANLVRQQLGVDTKWVVPLEFERESIVPGTNGVKVTMISANHCPGSSLFLFEKYFGNTVPARSQRILHCGDFRACKEHLVHPLLRPDICDRITGQSRQQKIDICYLDTTYLNPKYAFPPQKLVIKACADMCIEMNSTSLTDVTLEQNSGLMKNFLKPCPTENQKTRVAASSIGRTSRLLVVVGTYSIGKERICMGIAKALKTKIFAPPNKQRICAALEDGELSDLLVKDPRQAQVHMTPVFEIRAETLDDYLSEYGDAFTHVVGFRPTGWTYRPPNSRFIESPLVSTVLNGENWTSEYSMKDLAAQRGSTKRAACYGVPYSEHSSFRELTAFCCALRINKIVPTVNVGSAKSREKMRMWVDRWDAEKRKNGLFNADLF